MFVIIENDEVISNSVDLGNISEDAMVMQEMGRTVKVEELDDCQWQAAFDKIFLSEVDSDSKCKSGVTFFQGLNDRMDKGIRSKQIDKDKFFSKSKGIK